MTSEYVTSIHSRIEGYSRGAPANSRAAASTTSTTDPAAYLRRIQTLRERTHRWDNDRLRSGARRIAGLNPQETFPARDKEFNSTHFSRESTHAQMRRHRDAEIARRRQPAPPPRIGFIKGQRITDQAPFTLNLSASTPAAVNADDISSPPLVDPPDLDILRRLLRTPSRVLARGGNPWARLGSPHMPESKLPNNAPPPQSSSSTPAARLPPVRGRLLPISMARTLRSGHQQRLEDSLKATRLPYVVTSPHWHRMTSGNNHSTQQSTKQDMSFGAEMVPDLHGFRIYQHLMGAGTHRVIAQRHATATASRGAISELPSPDAQNLSGSDRHPTLPLPSFPITQILSKNPESSKSRVDYISINIAIPRAEGSNSQSPPPHPPVRPPSTENSERNFVPPPSPVIFMNSDDRGNEEENPEGEPTSNDEIDGMTNENSDKAEH